MIKKILILLLIIFIACFFHMYRCYLSYFSFHRCYADTKTQISDLAQTTKDWLYLISDRKFKGPSVSFCTTYKDRFWQISQTLPKNLKDNRMDKDHVEFVLVDFDPSDSTLKDFIFENFANDIASGYLKYYQTNKMPYWDFSLAKNTAHYYATNDVVVNLDADNYTGWRGGLYVAHNLAQNRKTFLWQYSGKPDGSYGRISLYKEDFDFLGGYDESLPAPAGYQDTDLIKRAESFLTIIHKNKYNQSIENQHNETIKHTNKKLSWDEMDAMNKEYSENNIKNGKFRANNGIYGIREGVYRIMSKEDEVK